MGGVTVQTEVYKKAPSDEQLIKGFLGDCELRRLSSETIQGYKSSLQITSKLLNSEGSSLTKLSKHSLKRVLGHLLERGYVYNTLVQYFSALSGFCDYLVWEGIAEMNPVIPFRKRYLKRYKNQQDPQRKLISVEDMANLIHSILDPRDRAIITLLAKTGIRRGELIDIDLDDIDWADQSIRLKPKPKRSNTLVFFDDECARVLKRWVRARRNYHVKPGCRALFVGEHGGRLKRHGVHYAVTKHAEKLGLHDPDSDRMEDHFTPHCCRHWFTTHLRRNGIRREFLKELRGDSRGEAVDIYDHIDKKELKRTYLAHIPELGI